MTTAIVQAVPMTPAIEKLSLGGLRGFSAAQELRFAVPNGDPGSGITAIVGSNNSGKSTIIEAIRYVIVNNPSPMSTGKRNVAYGDNVDLSLVRTDGLTRRLVSIEVGSSQTKFLDANKFDVAVVPSRRAFAPYFGDHGSLTRDQYMNSRPVPLQRSALIDNFAGRMFRIAEDPALKDEFNRLVEKVAPGLPPWTIDQSDEGQYYLKFSRSGLSHTSDGLGEGIVSLFFIIDSLQDSSASSMVVIDEPELSLHPQYQRRLYALISDYAKDRQIVYATHSPYFISWADVGHGAMVARVTNGSEGTEIHQPIESVLGEVASLASDLNNPHLLGLNANEAFFVEDGIVLVEGQEDVVFYERILQNLGLTLRSGFFGWGVGGAEKMAKFARLFEGLGFRAVAGVLDSDKSQERDTLRANFPNFRFECIPTDDVRPKAARKAVEAKEGLVDSSGQVRPEYADATSELFAGIDAHFNSVLST